MEIDINLVRDAWESLYRKGKQNQEGLMSIIDRLEAEVAQLEQEIEKLKAEMAAMAVECDIALAELLELREELAKKVGDG